MTLPFSRLWPIAIGAAVGVVLRLIFSGDPEAILTPMRSAFIVLTPALVGAVTVYIAERQQPRTWGYYLGAPVVANALLVLGTLLLYLEGWICAILIVPLFSIIGGASGVVMGALFRWTAWPRRALYGLAPLPLVLAAIEPLVPLPEGLEPVALRRGSGAAKRPATVCRKP